MIYVIFFSLIKNLILVSYSKFDPDNINYMKMKEMVFKHDDTESSRSYVRSSHFQLVKTFHDFLCEGFLNYYNDKKKKI